LRPIIREDSVQEVCIRLREVDRPALEGCIVRERASGLGQLTTVGELEDTALVRCITVGEVVISRGD
jgi:hypothetical protein